MERVDLLSDIWLGKGMSLSKRPDLGLWPEVQALESCIQDKEWHAEGNVLIHTDMVLNETNALLKGLSKHEGGALRLSALLHDIEKPNTTQYDETIGHVIAPKHERWGGVTSRYMLHDLGISPFNRRLVSQLVATHHLVKRAVKICDTPDGGVFLDRLAERVNTKLLYLLELADMRGRICKDQDKQIEIVELFKMLCEERDVFGKKPTPWISMEDVKAIPFVNPKVAEWCIHEIHRRRLLGSMKNVYQARAFCWEHAKDVYEPTEVFITIGPSGSGKSSHIEQYHDSHVIISTDSIRKELYGDEAAYGKQYSGAIPASLERLREQLRKGWNTHSSKVVYDATNVFYDHRKKILDLCYSYNAYVKLLVFDIPKEELKHRNQQRDRQVLDYVIDSQCAKFEWPAPEEAHDLIVIDSI